MVTFECSRAIGCNRARAHDVRADEALKVPLLTGSYTTSVLGGCYNILQCIVVGNRSTNQNHEMGKRGILKGSDVGGCWLEVMGIPYFFSIFVWDHSNKMLFVVFFYHIVYHILYFLRLCTMATKCASCMTQWVYNCAVNTSLDHHPTDGWPVVIP